MLCFTELAHTLMYVVLKLLEGFFLKLFEGFCGSVAHVGNHCSKFSTDQEISRAYFYTYTIKSDSSEVNLYNFLFILESSGLDLFLNLRN